MQMNQIVAVVVVVIIIILGGWFYISSSQSPASVPKVETPVANTESTTVETSMPTTDSSGTVETEVVREFVITGKNFSFTPSVMEVNKGDKVKITFKNEDGFHDLKIDEYNVATPKLQAGNEGVVEFTADKAGSFEYYCSIGSHRSMGMKGTIVVK